MPPFRADRNFQHYLNERGLSEEEILTIKTWIEQGAKEGKELKPYDLVQQNTENLRKPDLVLRMQNLYKIKGDNLEDFRFFNIPTNLLKDNYIESIEFIPDNKKLVHHSRIMVDTTNAIRGIDGLSETDSQVADFQRVKLKDEFLYGWTSGNEKIFFPDGMGRKLNANSDIILNMHYAPSPVEETDQSSINLYFSKKPVERDVKSLIFRENDISNQPFVLPAETKPTFYISKIIKNDISLISVYPHMHLLGKTFRAFAVTPKGEVVNLIKIDDWDIRWQMTYQFQKLLKIPAGSMFVIEASYDNTSENPENPNQPAQNVTYGWNTKDEMLNLIFYYVDYHAGDENIEQKR